MGGRSTCVACGGVDQPCCTTSYASSDATCNAGATCQYSATSFYGTCVVCGVSGEPCCEGDLCLTGTCRASGYCSSSN
jgi:hypothetical protein